MSFPPGSYGSVDRDGGELAMLNGRNCQIVTTCDAVSARPNVIE
jgi:hypothetical protein